MKLFDTHAHYDDVRFMNEYDGGTDGAILDCLNDCVGNIVNIGTNLDNSLASIKLAEKYKSREYLYDTPMSISFSCEKYFSWGTVRLELKVSDGEIKDVRLYTDAMDHNLPQSVSSALISCRFNKDDIKNALYSSLPQNIAMDLMGLIENEIL